MSGDFMYLRLLFLKSLPVRIDCEPNLNGCGGVGICNVIQRQNYFSFVFFVAWCLIKHRTRLHGVGLSLGTGTTLKSG
jgi:hypothetical protein